MATPPALPLETHEPEDEHEVKLHIESEGPIARIVERIERLASCEGGGSTLETIAGDIYRAFGIDGASGVSGIAHVDRVSVYHDTPSLDLHHHDASLRIRRRGNGKYRVTAKSEDGRGGSHGYVIRREWRYSLTPELFASLEQAGFLPLVEHHFGDVLEWPIDARRRLSPVVRIHKRSTRIEFIGPSGQRYLLSLDRFRGVDCRLGDDGRATREMREIEIEALNQKASQRLASIRDHVVLLPGIELGRAKYQHLVEALGIDVA